MTLKDGLLSMVQMLTVLLMVTALTKKTTLLCSHHEAKRKISLSYAAAHGKEDELGGCAIQCN